MLLIHSKMATNDVELGCSPCKLMKLDNGDNLNSEECIIPKSESSFSSKRKFKDTKSTVADLTSSDELSSGADSGFNEMMVVPCQSASSNDVHRKSFFSESVENNAFKSETKVIETAADADLIDHDDDQWEDISDDEVASTISNLSELSDLSDMSGQGWKPIAGPMSWVQRQMLTGADPRNVLNDLLPSGTLIPDNLDAMTLWRIIVNMLSEPPCRTKLANVNTLDNVVHLLSTCRRVIVLTGAGVSVSCGIPDFRSRNGIYARLSQDFPDLPDPQAMFDIHYFRTDPRPFFKFAKEIYPGQFKPSLAHRFIKHVEDHGKLLRNYTQNIDTLEQAAGIKNIIQCHGSFATASCTRCKFKVDASEIKEDIFEQKIPYCKNCEMTEGSDADSLLPAIMKPDIVFFGEGLSDEFHDTMAVDKDQCDLLIVIGSSLKVRPVALIPSSIPSKVPQILINREPLNHLNFDVELLGDCDMIIKELASRLGSGWSELCKNTLSLKQIDQDELYRREVKVCSSSVTSCNSCNIMPGEKNDSDISSNLNADSFYKRSSPSTDCLNNSFVFCPPSRYIFKGAEVNCRPIKSDVDEPTNRCKCLDQNTDSNRDKQPKNSVEDVGVCRSDFQTDEKCNGLVSKSIEVGDDVDGDSTSVFRCKCNELTVNCARLPCCSTDRNFVSEKNIFAENVYRTSCDSAGDVTSGGS